MRIAVAHLEGPRRGAADAPEGELLRIGSDPGAEILVDGALPDHATLAIRDGVATVEGKGPLRLNRAPVSRAALADGDLLEVGRVATLRIRLLDGDGFALPRPPRAAASFTPHGLLFAVVVAVVAACVVSIAYGMARLAGSNEKATAAITGEGQRQRDRWVEEREGYEARIAQLESDLRRLDNRVAPREEMEERVGEVKRAVLERVDTEVARSLGARPELKAARDAVSRLSREDAAVEQILATLAPSVCLIQGTYGFGKVVGGHWRYLREASKDVVEDLHVANDKVPLVLEGKGEIFKVEYTGTGFLADARGVVLTNRHIAEPWWRNEAAEPLLRDGFEPRFLLLRAYFPGRREAVQFDRPATLLSDDADLAALRFEPAGAMPRAIPLAEPGQAVIGRRVILLGYPSGLNALLARSDEEFAEQVAREDGYDPAALLDALAARGMVRPLPTQGHICDVVDEKVVFDAPTAGGGSGAPLLDLEGRVIAINYGILKAFSGANFGVPIEHARALLDRARR